MKKSFIIVGSLAIASVLGAQESRAQGVRVGVKAGANLSNLAGDVTNEDRFENKFGFVGGVMLNAPLIADGFLSIQPELLYSQKGFKNNSSSVFGTYKYEGRANYNYLDLPVLVKIKAGGFFVEAGPQFNYLINRNDKTVRTNNVTGTRADYNSGDYDLSNVNRFEVGYAAGLGFQSENGVILDLRYNGSFTDFTKDGYQGNDLRNARNSLFQLSLGYLITSR
ncbi:MULTISPECIES: porin family protein [Hymenobacter]|uniref:porin family protein n=1 Tax=Hymenobacter TaxID=89966 RepID=UPI001FB90FD6|nr:MULTISPECIES: porin family protein [Hymenobacter]